MDEWFEKAARSMAEDAGRRAVLKGCCRTRLMIMWAWLMLIVWARNDRTTKGRVKSASRAGGRSQMVVGGPGLATPASRPRRVPAGL
jgi:hypothetical protein